MDPAYCTTPGGNMFAEAARAVYCGIATVWTVPADAIAGVAGEASDAANEVSSNVAGGFGEVSSNVADAASPWNLFGLGAGVSLGGVLAVVGVGGIGAFAVDQLMFGGVGTASVARRLGGKR